MTKVLQDILKQPSELIKSLDFTLNDGRSELENAAKAIAQSPAVYLTGMGASLHATLAVQALFSKYRHKIHAIDAAELWHNIPLPNKSAIIILSRSGKSAEAVGLLDKAKTSNSIVIAITNDINSPIAQHAHFTLLLNAAYDYSVSITMYTALCLVAGLLAEACEDHNLHQIGGSLRNTLERLPETVDDWRNTLDNAAWFDSDGATCFLARGGSMASCFEAGLLWQEITKTPSMAMGTSNFRHGPVEVLQPGMRLGIWFHQHLRDEDLRLARDAKGYGASIMAIGQNLPLHCADLLFPLPPIDPSWEFLIDVLPTQLCAEHFAQLREIDGDHLKICAYIVEDQGGLDFQEKTS